MANEATGEDNLAQLTSNVAVLKKHVNAVSAKQLRTKSIQNRAKEVAQFYFRNVRRELMGMKIETVEIDASMERLLDLTSKDALTLAYRVLIRQIERLIPKIEVKRELFLSEATGDTPRTTLSGIDEKILNTLSELVPSAAFSYQQALKDLNDASKISYRGTAAELREVLRETLDTLAPDKDVEASPGFKYEKDEKGNLLPTPTMKQKVRFVLKSRGQSKTAIKTPESAVAIIEEHVASFARSTYDRGSLSTHQLTKRPEAQKLKGYVETVLCELLEIYR